MALLSAEGNAMHRQGLWNKNHMKSIGPLWDTNCLTQISDRPPLIFNLLKCHPRLMGSLQSWMTLRSSCLCGKSAVNNVTFGLPASVYTCESYTPFSPFQFIENTLLKYFMRRILWDFLTLRPCCTEAVGLLSSLVVISVSAGIGCVHPQIHTQKISQTHATNLFWVDLLLSSSQAKIPL